MIYKLILSILLVTPIIGHAQQGVVLEKDIQTSGNLIIGQDLSQDSVAGMIRWDTVSMTFQGYTGTEWITFSSPSPTAGTDTLEVGDSYGGGVVFFISGSHGLIVTDFDLGLPSNIISTLIPWGEYGNYTNATSTTDGAANTASIIYDLDTTYNNGVYAAKICDDLVSGGFDDWYLPSAVEFQTMSEAIGFSAPPPFTDLVSLTADYYWTSTEENSNTAIRYHTSSNSPGNFNKVFTHYVRAIRAY